MLSRDAQAKHPLHSRDRKHDHRWMESIRAVRDRGPAETFAAIDAVLARRYDEVAAVMMGIKFAEQYSDDDRRMQYRATLLGLRPDDTQNRVALARLMSQHDRFEAALDLLNRLPPALAETDTVIALKIGAAARLGAERVTRLMSSWRPEGTAPADVRRVYNMAKTLIAIGEPREALRWLELNSALEPKAPQLRYRRATLLYDLRYWQEADALFGRIEADGADPRHQLSATVFRARIARRTGDTALVQRSYASVFEAKPDHDEACEYLIRQHLQAERIAEAEAVLERFERASPGSPARTWLRAIIWTHQGETERALDLFRAAIARNRDNIEQYCRFADMLADAGRLEEMKEVLDLAASVDPASAPVFSRRIRVGHLTNRPEQLLELCERFLDANPNNENGLLQQANSLVRLGRRQEGLTKYIEGARIHNRAVAFWRSAAALAVSLNRKSEAGSLAEEARRFFDDTNAQDLCALAAIYEAASDADRALGFAQAAIRIEPRSEEANLAAARLLVARGRYGDAWPLLRQIAASPSRSHETSLLFAQTASAFRYLRPTQADLIAIEPIAGQFPDLLFDDIAGRSAILAAESCRDLVLHVSSSLAAGGAERQVAATVAGLAAGNGPLKVEFVGEDLDPANGRDVFLPAVEAAGVPVHILRDIRDKGAWRELLVESPGFADSVRLLGALPPDLGRLALPMFVLFAQRRPRVVHLWQDMISVAGCLAAILAGIPRIVLATRSTRPIEPQRFRPYFFSAYSAFLQRPGVSMISNSRSGARDYEAWLGLARDRVEVFHNGYDFASLRARTDRKRAAAARAAAAVPQDALVIGGVMRLSFEKRPELWTRTACALARRDPRVYGILVGEGPMRSELEEEIARRNLSDRIRLVGRQSPVEPWMSAMDVLFLSSVTEGLPNVLIEAQSLGVPVATMRVGGAPETVDEGRTAVVADEGPVEHIADVVGSLLFDPERRRMFGAAGVEWAQRMFGIDSMLGKLNELYERRS